MSYQNPNYHREYYLKNQQAVLLKSAKRYALKRNEIRKQSMDRYYNDLIGVMIDRTKQRAKKLSIPHTIRRSDILIPEFCPVFGCRLERSLEGHAKSNSPSIDKIDPTKGYIPGNIQILSYKANVMKNNASKDELIKFANWILGK